ncbi:hypothetical protein ColTof4_07924 [Colletotrichum tofieldiae]|nr:hypothetical protein ColTof3_02552 [Colletotrichum tofieldiae]GKT75501.1 hypothetical protein ColTof4_07924 [Colletotrichum tofieldiae]GKT83170.1 hypothetical protein Ct61P_01020 [Colletotrichum tofieldiae]
MALQVAVNVRVEGEDTAKDTRSVRSVMNAEEGVGQTKRSDGVDELASTTDCALQSSFSDKWDGINGIKA